MITDAGVVFFVRRTLIVLLLVALALLLWQVSYALLLAFGGVLFAVFLRGLADKVHGWTGLGEGWSLALVVLALVLLLVVSALILGPAISAEMGDLGKTLTAGVDKVRAYLEAQPWGERVLESLSQGTTDGGGLVRAVASVLTSITDVILAFVLVVFAGIYLAANPSSYVNGAIRLLPLARRARAREVLETTGNALWLWLVGQLVLMALVGVLTALGLLVIGAPLAPMLGLIAGLLNFIPFLGPFLASVPILLVAVTDSPQTALYAAAVMLLVQQAEGNVFAPLVERWAVSLPPVLVLIGAIAMTLLFGFIGAVLATPLLVVAFVLVQKLYMEDVLGEDVESPGEAS